MANFFGTISRDEVDSPEVFASYCQQALGTPYPSGKQIATLRRNIKEFFKQNPQASYGTLVRTIDWLRSRRKRVPHCYSVINSVRFAWRDGYLPELDPVETKDESFEDLITEALKVEQDPWWRDRLTGGLTPKAKLEIYQSWVEARSEA